MKVAILTYDSRESPDYSGITHPLFGSAPKALLQGFTQLNLLANDTQTSSAHEIRIHVVSFSVRPTSHFTIGGVLYHSLQLPIDARLRFGFVGYYRAVRAFLRELKPDLVHAQGMETWCAFVGSLLPYPKILTIHGYLPTILRQSPMGLSMNLRSHMGKWALGKYAGVVCISRYIQRAVKGMASRTFTIPNAVEELFFTTPRQCQTNHGLPLLLVVGTISPLKSQVKILEMLSDISKAGRHFNVAFIGDLGPSPDYNSIFLEHVEANSDFATFKGHLLTPNLICELDGASALIHTPKEEAFGLAVAESLVRGLQCFCFAVGGLPDIAPDSQQMTFVENGRWDLLAHKIKDWLDRGAPKPTQCATYDHLRPVNVAGQHLDAYREVIDAGINYSN